MVLLVARLRRQLAHIHLVARHNKNKAAKLRRELHRLRFAIQRLLRLRFETQRLLQDRHNAYYEHQAYSEAIRQQMEEGPMRGWISDECDT